MSDIVHRHGHPFVRYRPERVDPAVGLERGLAFEAELDARRSVRFFRDAPVPRAMIETAIRAASTAPSGAHMQPWTFVAVSDPAIKHQIRLATEREERRNYEQRMPPDWIEALEPMGTTADKSYYDVVPWVVVVFAQQHGWHADGSKKKHYYVRESVGIACGLFVASVHRMGLATLTHTPNPMKFLSEILGRPKNEQAMIVFPVGYPAEDCIVPDLARKPLSEVAVFNPAPRDGWEPLSEPSEAG